MAVLTKSYAVIGVCTVFLIPFIPVEVMRMKPIPTLAVKPTDVTREVIPLHNFFDEGVVLGILPSALSLFVSKVGVPFRVIFPNIVLRLPLSITCYRTEVVPASLNEIIGLVGDSATFFARHRVPVVVVCLLTSESSCLLRLTNLLFSFFTVGSVVKRVVGASQSDTLPLVLAPSRTETPSLTIEVSLPNPFLLTAVMTSENYRVMLTEVFAPALSRTKDGVQDLTWIPFDNLATMGARLFHLSHR